MAARRWWWVSYRGRSRGVRCSAHGRGLLRAAGFYVVQSGHFDIEVTGQGVVATSGPFGSFGELSIVFRQPRSATVRATEAERRLAARANQPLGTPASG